MRKAMVRRARPGAACAAVAVLSLAGVLTSAAAQTIQVGPNNRTIAVTVSGKAAAEATVAVVHIGFSAYAPDAGSAYAEGSKTSNAIVEALHRAGIADKSIESQGQSLRQNYELPAQASELERSQKRYILTQSWTVKTRATDAARVLDVAVKAGANQSGEIDWDVADHAALHAEAAAQAVEHARALASEMARGLGVELGPLLYASNQAPETPVRPLPLARMAATEQAAVKPLAIVPQKIVENATVYAVFSIR